MFEDLSGKVAVVTGGARGLGLQMATALAGVGCRIALLDRLADAAAGSAASLAADCGIEAIGVEVDVTDRESVTAAFAAVAGRFGSPQVLINAAGISAWADSAEAGAADWDRVLAVNASGTFYCCQAFAQAVFAAGGAGTIINISSMSAFVVNVPQRQAAYNASKAAVDQLTRSLAVEWIARGIRVNAIAPGYFLSDMTKVAIDRDPELGRSWVDRIPAGRMGDPADLDGLVVFLASDASRYVVGESIVIDGGYSII